MPPNPQSEPVPIPGFEGPPPEPQAPSRDKSTPDGRLEGVVLFDSRGQVLASDALANRWLCRASADEDEGLPALSHLVGERLAAAWLDNLFGPVAPEILTESWHVDGSTSSAVTVELRRLDGPTGPAAVASFRPSSSGLFLSRDPLTGLADRGAIVPWIARLPQDEFGARRPFAVLFLDLNDFKQINDVHGHAAGDAVLAKLARRWSTAVRDGDLVTRYGGDEFVILLKNVADVDSAEPVVERLRTATLAPIALGGTEVSLSATIGIAVSADGNASIESLIAAADEDMYARKRRRPK